MDETLTGRDAAEAIGLALRLGHSDARFDARQVARALRSRLGRRRLSVGLFSALRRCAPRTSRPARPRGQRGRRTALRGVLAAVADPGRPRPPTEARRG